MTHVRGVLMLLLTVLVAAGAAASSPIVVPSGTPIHFKLLRTISTATAKPGQSVPAELTAPLVVDGRTVANAGAPAVVYIRNAESSGRVGGSARLTFSLASITLVNGSTAVVHTSSYSREGKAHAKHNATYIGGAAIIGALAGQALGHDRNATEKGAAIGAGVGIGAAAATGKFDFTTEAGHRFRLTLRAPLKTTI
jgi:hypothetical protein